MFESFKKKTVEDIVENAKDKVTEVVNTGMEEKVKGVAMLLPLIFTGALMFSGGSSRKHRIDDIPTKQVIINNYYYRSEQNGGMKDVSSDRKSRHGISLHGRK